MASGVVKVGVASYLGELFRQTKRPNTFLRMLGGLQGGVIETSAREFPIGVYYDLRAPAQPANLEGADAPTAEHRTLTQTTNVVQIFHEQVSLTYLAASDKTVTGIIPLPSAAAQGGVQNPKSEEFQVMLALQTIAQDANYSFLRGAYVNPADPSGTALKTRGCLTSITTNVSDKSGEAAPDAETYKGWVEGLLMTMIQQTGFNPDDTWTVFGNTTEYNNIQAAWESKTTPPYDREVAGLKLRQLYTRFGILNLALEPDMPTAHVMICNMGMCGVVGLPVPSKGVLFEEPLYKSGSADKTQIYGQLGVDHGPEYMHGLLKVPAVTL